MSDSFDVIVIGGGPAGYPAAIRAGQNKLSVACIDEWRNHDGSAAFGGTCLNAGCIPSKALLESSELYHRAQHEFAVHGLKLDGIGFDVTAMQKRKAGIVRQSTQGILALFKGAGVVPMQGHGRLLAGREVEFTAHDGAKRLLRAKHVVLASGSEAMPLRGIAFDGEYIVDSWGALDFASVPKHLCVIGAGVIGLVRMKRPAPDSQRVDYAAERERTVAQSHIRMGAGHEQRTVCGIGCPCGDDRGGGGGAERRGALAGDRSEPTGVGAAADRQARSAGESAGLL